MRPSKLGVAHHDHKSRAANAGSPLTCAALSPLSDGRDLPVWHATTEIGSLMTFFKWMTRHDNEGWWDLIIGFLVLCVIALGLLLLWGILWTMVNGYWEPFAVLFGISLFLFLALGVGHLTRILFNDSGHIHE
jgi:RsiW-degrading membrane proteinase PrsW (M82 family)